jgi:hypothetical protein
MKSRGWYSSQTERQLVCDRKDAVATVTEMCRNTEQGMAISARQGKLSRVFKKGKRLAHKAST